MIDVTRLTEAQLRVFETAACGFLNKEIAHMLGVSEATVKAHLSEVMRRLELRPGRANIALAYVSTLGSEELRIFLNNAKCGCR